MGQPVTDCKDLIVIQLDRWYIVAPYPKNNHSECF